MDLTQGEISKHVKAIAIPAGLGFFFNTMFNVVDTYFAGWISTDALAALTISFPIFFIIIAFVQGLATGASALISNALGSKNEKRIEHISAQVLSFAFLFYCALLPICLIYSPKLFGLLGAQGAYLEMVQSYMNIIFYGSFFLILLYSANAILLSHGNSTVLKNFLIGGFFLNAILDPWFLFGGFGLPAMGIQGIALATVVTMALGFFYVIFKVIEAGYLSVTSFSDFLPEKKHFLDIAKQSFPASLNMMTIGIGIFIINFFIKDFGKPAVAAFGIGTRIEQISLMPVIGLTIAVLTIIGQNNGAKLYSRVQETLHISVKYGAIITLFGFLLMFFLPGLLFNIFSNDPEVITIGTTYLRIAAFTSWAYMILAIYISSLQGMKRPFYALVIGCIRQIILPVALFYFLTQVFDLGLKSIWWGIFLITWSAALITIYYTRYVIQRKLNTSLTDSNNS